MIKSKFPFYKQLDLKDCGPTCLRMIAKHYGKTFSREFLREISGITKTGVTLAGISDAANQIEMRTLGVNINLNSLVNEAPTPFIVSWRQKHFVVVYKTTNTKIYVADPAQGLLDYSHQEFLDAWSNNSNQTGFALLLEPNTNFYSQNVQEDKKIGFSFLIPYLSPYKKIAYQLLLGIIVSITIQFILPFIIQSVVDVGVQNKNIHFIYLMLIAQLVLISTQTSVNVFREWLITHVNGRFNIKIVSDFLYKILKLPINYFETRNSGEHIQRISDLTRIQNFISTFSIGFIYSTILFLAFSLVLFFFDIKIFIIYIVGTIIHIGWTLLFIKKRSELDYKNFDELSKSQTSLLEIINGSKEIKINNSQRKNRWKWEHIQINIFNTTLKSLKISHYQNIGSIFINEIKNIFIIFLSAMAVINGEITLGMMLSIQYIIGQLNAPLDNFINFIRVYQDTKISLERLSQVYSIKNEVNRLSINLKELPTNKTIYIKNLSFKYGSKSSSFVLNNLTFEIPENKITAIVGSSGSGKTTLLQVLLKLYEPTSGDIYVGNDNLNNLDHDFWRLNCGAVLQDNFIFNDTIAGNISESEQNELVNIEKIKLSAQISCADEFIEKLPNKYKTQLGSTGMRLSGGQEQRLMIARAVYKNPKFIFFDEATSSLDANNEKKIMQNLQTFIEGKTAVVIAHRLSTVKNADNIIVLENGQIIEQGSHEQLIAKKNKYYELIKNQLELGT